MGLFDMFKSSAAPSADEIMHDDLVAAIEAKSCALIDVREPPEFAAGHAPGAINQTLSTFNPGKLPKGKPIVLICQAGVRSARALSAARAAGVGNIRHDKPGTGGWAKADGELV